MRSLILSINVEESIFQYSPERCIKSLPESFQKDVLKYKYNKMRWMSYLGKLLLLKGLIFLDKPVLAQQPLEYNAYKKPYLSKDLDFNISHSGNKVVCAITKSGKVGVDVQEKNRKIRGSKALFLSQEETAQQINVDLIDAWCKKEAVSKAVGKGLQLDFTTINTLSNPVDSDSEKWYLTPIPITPDYVCYMATNLIGDSVSFLRYKLDQEKLLNLSSC